jgi:serine/threonine-protein kinase
MELREGETLRERVLRTGPLPADRARRFAIDLSGALAEAHGRGIVHRDITPENLFIATIGGERDVIKLLDFGLVKTEAAEEGLTRSGWIGGTPAYISPEAAAGKTVDASSDIYSLGASLYFALTGAAPFAATSLGALLQAHMTEGVEPPSQRAAGIPADLERVILRCLEKDPAGRPSNGTALLELLEGQR